MCAICGLLGMALALVALHVYLIVNGLEHTDLLGHGELVAGELVSMFWEAGALLGLATAVFLLAPEPDLPD